MKKQEIKKLSKDEVVKNIDKLKKDLFNFRFQKMNSQVTNPAKISETKKNMGWCDDPKSKRYNKLISSPCSYSYEQLFKRENIYDIILVLNYNMYPIKKNKGSAIFIHVAKKDYKKTKGCVAIKKSDLLKILKEIKINTEVKIERQKQNFQF